MSRIGKMPVNIPQGIKVDLEANNFIRVTGPLGKLERKLDSEIILNIEDNVINISRPTEQKKHRALHGLSRALVFNMVEGVSNGFTIELEIIGVGYKASANGQRLELSLGYSHDIIFELPEEVKFEAISEKGKNPRVILKSFDKELLGLVAAKIRSYRKPEPYKGKGILYKGEVIRRKAGKSASS